MGSKFFVAAAVRPGCTCSGGGGLLSIAGAALALVAGVALSGCDGTKATAGSSRPMESPPSLEVRVPIDFKKPVVEIPPQYQDAQ